MQTPGKTPSKGNKETKYRTFKKKSDAKNYFTQIDEKNICFKNKIYDTFYMIGEWSHDDGNTRVRTLTAGYFQCSMCSKVLGIHDMGELHAVRVAAGKKLDFEDEISRKKWESKKWNAEGMRDHQCGVITVDAPSVETTSASIVNATPTASTSSHRLGSKKRKVSVINSKQIQDATREEIKGGGSKPGRKSPILGQH